MLQYWIVAGLGPMTAWVVRRRPGPAGERMAVLFSTPWALAAAVVVGALLAGCTTTGSDRSGTATGADSSPSDPGGAAPNCAPEVTEVLDAGSALHLLPGAPEPTYISDPPTSGPHLSGPAPSGVLEAPMGRPAQVQVLEQGGVVIQHRDLEPAAVERLEALAGDLVVVAPNPTLPSTVVATAWVAKRTCEGLDLDSLGQFIADHRLADRDH